MRNSKNCPHIELMESSAEKDRLTGEWIVQFYRCVDCGRQVDAHNVNSMPPSRGHKRVFAIKD